MNGIMERGGPVIQVVAQSNTGMNGRFSFQQLDLLPHNRDLKLRAEILPRWLGFGHTAA